MLSKIRHLGLFLGISTITACTSYSTSNYQPYQYSIEYTERYLTEYQSSPYVPDEYEASKSVAVPESYHIGPNHSPISHQNLDKAWINKQKPEDYTIELADGDKAAEVANTLYKAPKSDRVAEIKYQKDGKTYYKGLYGSYPSLEAAQQALSTLPDEVKQKAGVQTWSSVQRGAHE